MAASFSRRNNLRASQAIHVREDAPRALREALPMIAREEGLSSDGLRWAACNALRCTPDSNNWSSDNVWNEAVGLIEQCDWYEVYDIAETIYRAISRANDNGRLQDPAGFQAKLNEVFVEEGIGWQMIDGTIQFRGGEGFEQSLTAAQSAAAASGRNTAAGEISEALRDMSRRPHPDSTGAVQHALAALECVARDVVGEPSRTLGDLIKHFREELDIPRPLDQAVEKVWGFASEVGRHLREGREPTIEEAELVVAMCAAIVTFLCRHVREGQDAE